MSKVWIQVLGPIRVWRDARELHLGARQQRRLLAIMAAQVDHPMNITDIVDAIWAGEPPKSAVNVIHKYIHALRHLLEPDVASRRQGSWLVRHGRHYQFVAGPTQLDLVAFRQSTELARESLQKGNPGDALGQYLVGLRLWRGHPADHLAETARAAGIFASLENELVETAKDAAELAIRLRQPGRVLPMLRHAARTRQLDEPLHAVLARTLAAAGQRAEALTALRKMRERLAEELGVDPGGELEHALQEVLNRNVSAEVRFVPVADAGETTESPTPAGAEPAVAGQGAITLGQIKPAQLPPDLPSFAGRESELSALMRLVEDRRSSENGPLIVSLDGRAGVGKSALARHFAGRIARQMIDGQLYLDLGGEGDGALAPDIALRSLFYGLGVPATRLPDSFEALVGMYRSFTAQSRLLLLLDNARDASQIRPLVPNSTRSIVLVTTREPLIELAALDGAHLLHIARPDIRSAKAMLQMRLPALSESHPELIDEIIDRCARLPIAMAVAAAKISADTRLAPVIRK